MNKEVPLFGEMAERLNAAVLKTTLVVPPDTETPR
jgi:hypothetical protein